MIPLADITLGYMLGVFGGYIALCILAPVTVVALCVVLYRCASALLSNEPSDGVSS